MSLRGWWENGGLWWLRNPRAGVGVTSWWTSDPRRSVASLVARRSARRWREHQANLLGVFPFDLLGADGLQEGQRVGELWCPRCRALVDVSELGPVHLLDDSIDWFHLPHGYWPDNTGWRETVCARSRL